ncbi:hypothetical protein [Cupriavidus sp. UYPR2.512]|uniref:hypothetical protein n=1 Tax=Cupriavidus sp. UYPR2.512 TaxID=1080187 RepID=UPI00037284D4|nr:hypothetical protein [Cupriavidus sp. UYPR2.512]UIF90929.1 hypothetical protein KAF44_32615 [Cupriavidus necator]
MSNVVEQFKAVAARNNEQIAKLREESAALIKPLLQDFIKQNPEVKQIKWAQYTPYFNDGDTCTFGLHSFGFYFEGDDLSESRYEFELSTWQGYDKFEKREACSRETWDNCVALEKQLNSVGSELESIFGDHVEVVVTPDGVEVEEYDHD